MDINNQEDIPDETPLEEVYTNEKILRLLVDEDLMDEESDGINVVERFGTIPRLKYIKEGGKAAG